MSQPLQRDALRIIVDIIREATGTALSAEARRRLEGVLKSLAAGDVPESLAKLSILELETGLLVAGAKLRGETGIALVSAPVAAT